MFLVAALGICGEGRVLFAQAPAASENTENLPASPEMCRLLDDPSKRDRMDGLLFNLLWSCGRQNELGRQPGQTGEESFAEGAEVIQALDILVNNPAGETGTATTQSETTIAYNPVTGTYCSAFNDSWEFYGGTGGGGLTGFARSIDGGASWQDRGAVGGPSRGDPSLAWRRADGFFYLATLYSGGGLAVGRSTDDCGHFSLVSVPATNGDDKEMLAADNNPASPYYGNLYLVWTDFGVSSTPIRAIRSTDGGQSWSPPVDLSAGVVIGAWPAVAPNGDLFVSWLRYASWPDGNISIEVARSTNGGVTYVPVTSPLPNAVSPRDATASADCSRPSLNGHVRLLAAPQIAVDGNGVLHVVYVQDPDGFNAGDVINVYYRRSTDSGTSWSPPIQLNDVGTGDQYHPSLQVYGTTLVAGWYDRRHDGANLLQDYYKRVSTDGGLTWGANLRVTDVSSPIHLDPNLAYCYHGDYDQSAVTAGGHVMQWADDRNFIGSRNDSDVWTETFDVAQVPLPVAQFSFVCTGLSCAFDGTGSTGTEIIHAWSFGDSTSGAGTTASHVYGAAGSFTVTLTVTDSLSRQASRSRRVSVISGTPPPGEGYFTLVPCRLVDTRLADHGAPALAAGATRTFQVQGNCGVPVGAKAGVLNFTVVGPAGPGYLSAFPSGITPPLASTLNFNPNQTRANGVILGLSTNAEDLAVRAEGSGAHLVIDVFGYFQ